MSGMVRGIAESQPGGAPATGGRPLLVRYAARPMPDPPATSDHAMARRSGLRFLAATLAGLWTALAASILVAYRPGGPFDLVVGAIAFLPAIVAAAAIAWPPLLREWRAAVAVAWLGIVAGLLVTPLLIEVIEALAAGGGHTLFPSAEMAYAAVLAMATTSLFAAIGVIRAKTGADVDTRRPIAAAVGSATLLTLIAAVCFGGAALANDIALRDRVQATSRFGPTDPSRLPPHCDEDLRLGPGASLDIRAEATIDGQRVGVATLDGSRSALDEMWVASLRSRFATGRAQYSRVAGVVRLSEDGHPAAPLDQDGFDLLGTDGLTVDGPVRATALGAAGRPLADELGIELIEGAQARHCRVAIDGPTAVRSSLPLRWLAGGDLAEPARSLDAWRGNLDWWVFGDGQLGRAAITVSGYPGDAWSTSGLQGELMARMNAVERTLPHAVVPVPTAPTGAPSGIATSSTGAAR